jgi:hypothetical protein
VSTTDDPAAQVGSAELGVMVALWMLLVPDGRPQTSVEATRAAETRRVLREAVRSILQRAPWISAEVRELVVSVMQDPGAASFLDAAASADADDARPASGPSTSPRG